MSAVKISSAVLRCTTDTPVTSRPVALVSSRVTRAFVSSVTVSWVRAGSTQTTCASHFE